MTKVVFFGSDEYSLIVLKTLAKDRRFKIVAVVTLTHAKAIQKFAQEKKILLINFTSIIRIIEEIKPNKPAVGILASFGKILPKKILKIPKHGILNIHPSLLPKYRGTTPVPAAILNGEKETGVTIIKMDENVDHGPIVSQFKESIKPDDTSQSLYDRLFSAGAEVLKIILPAYLEGRIELQEQDHNKATYTEKLSRDDGFIPSEILTSAIEGKELQSDKASRWQNSSATLQLCNSATFLERFIRAMDPWPGAWTLLRSPSFGGQAKRLKILKAHLENSQLILDRVQLEGKKPVSWKQFQAGYPEAQFTS